MNEKLTDEQVAKWREALIPMFGCYALIMPVDEIQKIHDNLQNKIDKNKETK